MRAQIHSIVHDRCRHFLSGAAILLSVYGTTALAQDSAPETDVSRLQQIDMYVSEDALQAMYTHGASLLEGRETTLQGGVFFTEARDIVGIAAALSRVADTNRFPRWDFDIGARAYGALLEGEDEDVFGVALGGQARYALWGDGQVAVAFGLFYAPDILTFGAADSVYDTFGRVELMLRDGLTAFVGYRLLEFDMVANRELDDHAHVGVRWTF